MRPLALLALSVAVAGCGGSTTADDRSSTKPAEKAPTKKRASKPRYVRAFEKRVEQEELLYVRSKGYEGEVEVRCYPTKVKRGTKLQAGCETQAYGTATGDITDAEELHARAYNIVYDPQRPSSFEVEAPADDPLQPASP